MPGLVRMSLDSPEETRPFEDGTGQLQLINVKEGGVRFTLLGGQQATLIIDPTSGQIRATNFFVDNQGATFWQQIPNATITGRWTNTLP
jgi:hypothetical protein